jgi:hypothetical protein
MSYKTKGEMKMFTLKKGWGELLENKMCGKCPDKISEDYFGPDCEDCIVKTMINTFRLDLIEVINIIVEKRE